MQQGDRNIYRTNGSAALKVEQQPIAQRASIIDFESVRPQRSSANTEQTNLWNEVFGPVSLERIREVLLAGFVKRDHLTVRNFLYCTMGFASLAIIFSALVLIGA